MWIGIATGVAFRVWILSSSMGMLDSDESTVGLMARHLLRGEFRFFFWGQDYGGTPNVAVEAAFFAVLGANRIALKLVPILQCAAAAWLVWRLGRRTIGEPAAKIAAVLFWVWPAMFVWFSTHEQLFYYNTVVLGLVAALGAVRLAQGDGSRLDAVAAGLAIGVGWWASPQIAYFAFPVVLWLVWTLRRRVLPIAAVAIPAALLGALPWLWHNVQHPLISLKLPADAPVAGYATRALGFFETGLPISLGLRLPYGGEWFPAALGVAVYVAVLVVFAIRARRPPAGTGLLFLIAGLCPAIFTLSPLSGFVIAPRYLVFLSPIAALLLARAMFVSRRKHLLLSAGLVVAIGMTWSALALTDTRQSTILTAPDRKVPNDFTPLVDALERNGIRHAFANYWIAYRLTFESGERIIATPFVASRYPPYDEAVGRSPQAAYVFLTGSTSIPLFERAIGRIGVEVRRVVAESFTIFVPQRTVTPEELGGLPGEM
jgi:4-amino-4-deoxy-L-arabinose transferase-like glycosyltransferase